MKNSCAKPYRRKSGENRMQNSSLGIVWDLDPVFRPSVVVKEKGKKKNQLMFVLSALD